MKKGTVLLYIIIFTLGFLVEAPSLERAILLTAMGLLGLIFLMLPLHKGFEKHSHLKTLLVLISPIMIWLMEQQSRYSVNDYFQMLYFVLLIGLYQYGQKKLFQMASTLGLACLSWKYLYIMKVNPQLIKLPQLVVAITLFGLLAIILWLGLKLNQEKSNALQLNLKLEERQEKLEKANLQLEKLMDELESLTVYRERQRMAREIHDTVGHALTALTMKLEMSKHFAQNNDNTQMALLLQESIDDSRMTLKMTRQVVETLTNQRRSPEDLLQLVKRYEGQLSFEICCTGEDYLNLLSVEQSHVVYRMVQEAITNCMKHSNANQLTVEMSLEKEKVKVLIKDNGQVSHGIKEGFGLKGMGERAKEVNGQFQYSSFDGFMLEMILPYKEELIP